MNFSLLASAVNQQYTYDPVSGQQAYNLAAIKLDKEISARYGHVLTDATVQQMLSDFQPTAEILARTGGIHGCLYPAKFYAGGCAISLCQP